MIDTSPDTEVEEHPCANHAGRLTAVACGKCGTFICPKCMIFTPVGVRCKPCAQLRRPAQFDVPLDRLALAAIVSLAASLVAWTIALEAYFLVWLLSIFVGLAVGEVASRIAKRRTNVWLELVVGVDIVVGFVLVSEEVLAREYFSKPGVGFAAGVGLVSGLTLIPLVLAVLAGVTRLRR